MRAQEWLWSLQNWLNQHPEYKECQVIGYHGGHLTTKPRVFPGDGKNERVLYIGEWSNSPQQSEESLKNLQPLKDQI